MLKEDFEKAFASIASRCNGNGKSVFGIKVTTRTTLDLNKGGRKGIPNNPYYGLIEVETEYTNIFLGTSYSNLVNAERAKEGKETDFVAQKLNGKHHIPNSVLTESDKVEGLYYLPLMLRMVANNGQAQTKVNKTYHYNGKQLTKEQVETMCQLWLKPKSHNNSQGLSEEVIYFAPKLENVISVTI